MKKIKPFKCKFCNRIFDEYEQYADHLERVHSDLIPDNMSPFQFIYYLNNKGKTHGKCVVCGAKTLWNERTRKYKRFCENPACKEKYIAEFKKRMIGKYGKTTLLNDPEHQKEMLANRKISGKYPWSTGGYTSYTGSYELSFLQFLDLILEYTAEDVIAPSPHTYYYEYEGKTKFYIPDIYIPSLNLEIEIKDGGDNVNKHPKIQAVDKVKERLKDEVLASNKNGINYIKIVNKDNRKFFSFLDVARYNYLNNIDETIIML